MVGFLGTVMQRASQNAPEFLPVPNVAFSWLGARLVGAAPGWFLALSHNAAHLLFSSQCFHEGDCGCSGSPSALLLVSVSPWILTDTCSISCLVTLAARQKGGSELPGLNHDLGALVSTPSL